MTQLLCPQTLCPVTLSLSLSLSLLFRYAITSKKLLGKRKRDSSSKHSLGKNIRYVVYRIPYVQTMNE